MRTLLLADDSITVQRVIALTFAAEQIQVVTVGDGRQAIEKMAAQRPDIVLAGTSLPQMNGFDLAKFMRGQAEFRTVPVLLLSSAFETVDQIRLAESGADGIIEKPVEPTAVISRVKELLGMKSDDKPAMAPGRSVTPANAPSDRKLPVAPPPRPVTSTRGPSNWEQLRDSSGLEADAPSVEASSSRPADYLATLDAAFDSLDQQLSGRPPAAPPPRNPSGPIGPSAGPADPRSPGRTPSVASSTGGNPVFEIDDDWFGSAESEAQADARATRRQIAEDLGDPSLQAPVAPKPPANSVFEVDDEWFAEDDKARAAKRAEHQQLAEQMGVHEVGLAGAKPATAADSDLDFDFGLDDGKSAPAVEPSPSAAPTPPAPTATIAPLAELPARVADEFAHLLAFEHGQRREPAAPAPPEIKLVAPEITDELLDQIAGRVTDRLNASTFGEQLKDAMLTTMRDTVRSVVTETSQRIVSDLVPAIVAETSERLIRESVPAVVADTSARLIRESVPAVVADTSERLIRDSVPTVVADTSERLIRESVTTIVAESSERVVREAALAAVREASDRQVRDLATVTVAETSDRLVREGLSSVLAETTDRLVREQAMPIVSEASDRVVRESVHAVVSDMSDRMLRDTVPAHVSEASDRHVRDRVATILAETAERLARETVRTVVSETSERLVRDEIERIKSRAAK